MIALSIPPNRRDGQQWQDAINTLHPAAQQAVASVVWWDYFANRSVAERWPHLDQWVRKKGAFFDITYKSLYDGLIKIGYSTAQATRRLQYAKKVCPDRGF